MGRWRPHWISTRCHQPVPACHILLVEGNNNALDSLGEAVDTAVSLGAHFVSNSYGVGGGVVGEQDLNHYYDHPGVAVTASTGDAGNVASWPSTDPNVVAVGGTTLVRDQSVARGWAETAWRNGGSGCSQYEPKPAYQQDIATGCANRAEADLSADADPNTGLAVYDTDGQDGWLQVGGTSLASPLTAAMYALAGMSYARQLSGDLPVCRAHAPQRRDWRQRRYVRQRALHRRSGMGRADRPGHAQRCRRIERGAVRDGRR